MVDPCFNKELYTNHTQENKLKFSESGSFHNFALQDIKNIENCILERAFYIFTVRVSDKP